MQDSSVIDSVCYREVDVDVDVLASMFFNVLLNQGLVLLSVCLQAGVCVVKPNEKHVQ